MKHLTCALAWEEKNKTDHKPANRAGFISLQQGLHKLGHKLKKTNVVDLG